MFDPRCADLCMCLTSEGRFHFHLPKVESWSAITLNLNLRSVATSMICDIWANRDPTCSFHASMIQMLRMEFCVWYVVKIKTFIFIDSGFFNEREGRDVFRRLQTSLGGRRLPSQELAVYDSFSSLLTFLTPRPRSVEFSQVSSNCSGSLPQSKEEHESRLLLWISHKCECLSFCVSCTRQYIGTSHCQTIWSYVVWLRIRRLWV